MGKIFDALEKYRKERKITVSQEIKDSDYEVLRQFDEATGKLDIHNPQLLKDARGLKRLMTYRLIHADGSLTPAGRAKYEEMKGKHKESEPADQMIPPQLKEMVRPETPAEKPELMTPSDRAVLMQYDRKTGNLLKYDPETGQLDQSSTEILKDPTIIQRLIDSKMIMPGGWLTPEAKVECAQGGEKFKGKKIEDTAKQKKIAAKDIRDEPSGASETLDRTAMKVLMDHDPQTRKLNMSSPLIVKDPAIVKRLLENNMIAPDGKLTPQALVRCRVLTNMQQLSREKEQARPKQKSGQKPPAREKLQTVPEKRETQKPPEETGTDKLKIIRLKKDTEEVKTVEDKHREKPDDLIPAFEAHAAVAEPKKALPEKPFTLEKAPVKYAGRAIDKELVVLMNPQSFEAEQFKILRTNLLFPASGKTPRSVMVTSTAPGEGKSFVASNLAISVAKHINRHVLLIDCDLRRPAIHRQFGYHDTPGLSEYLSNGVQALQPLLLRTGIDHLTILPAGKPPDNPSELLSSERMSDLLEEVAARYKDRLIIIDSPPPRLAAESGALARQVDGILVVVKYGSTPRESATELVAKLGKDKIIGAIVNNFDAGSSRYHKKYYGGSYYG